jgi:hypothetical protein
MGHGFFLRNLLVGQTPQKIFSISNSENGIIHYTIHDAALPSPPSKQSFREFPRNLTFSSVLVGY